MKERSDEVELKIYKSENGMVLDYYKNMLNKRGYNGSDMLSKWH